MAMYDEQSRIRARLQQSLANQQAAFLGQQRGKRKISDIERQYTEGYDPYVSGFAQRGLIGPSVESGIARTGLEKYAQNLQRDLGTETQNMQDELNNIAITDANQQADLEDYLAQLRLQQQADILSSAQTIKNYGAY